MDRERAEILGLRALGYVAADAELLSRFMALSGLTPESLRAAAGDAAVLAGLLDFVLFDDRLVVAVAEASNAAPEEVAAARRALSAGTDRAETDQVGADQAKEADGDA